MYNQMARIAIEPVWARFFDFRAGRMPAFLTKLAGGAEQAIGSQHPSSSASRCIWCARVATGPAARSTARHGPNSPALPRTCRWPIVKRHRRPLAVRGGRALAPCASSSSAVAGWPPWQAPERVGDRLGRIDTGVVAAAARLLCVSVEDDLQLVRRGRDVDLSVLHFNEDVTDDNQVRIGDLEPHGGTGGRIPFGWGYGLDELRWAAAYRFHEPITTGITVASNRQEYRPIGRWTYAFRSGRGQAARWGDR